MLHKYLQNIFMNMFLLISTRFAKLLKKRKKMCKIGRLNMMQVFSNY